MKITFNNYTYKLKKLTTGKYYIAKCFSFKGYKKFLSGELLNKSGIITFN